MSPSQPPLRGDTFKLIFHAYLGFVWQRVRLAGVRDGDVADVVQEVFVALAGAIARKKEVDTSTPLSG